jgi:hypothetical protein
LYWPFYYSLFYFYFFLLVLSHFFSSTFFSFPLRWHRSVFFCIFYWAYKLQIYSMVYTGTVLHILQSNVGNKHICRLQYYSTTNVPSLSLKHKPFSHRFLNLSSSSFVWVSLIYWCFLVQNVLRPMERLLLLPYLSLGEVQYRSTLPALGVSKSSYLCTY